MFSDQIQKNRQSNLNTFNWYYLKKWESLRYYFMDHIKTAC